MSDIFDQLATGQNPAPASTQNRQNAQPASVNKDDVFDQALNGQTASIASAGPDVSNPKGEGTYSLRDSSGNVFDVPYSKVPGLTQTGYKFADSDTFHRYRRDVSADPSSTGDLGGWGSTNFSPAQQTVIRRESNTTVGQAAQGFNQGVGDTLSQFDILNLAKSAWNSFAPVAAYKSIQQSLPAFAAYEHARSSGASVQDALKAASDAGAAQNALRQELKKRADDFYANPTQATARALTDVAGLVGTAYATHSVVAPEVAPEAEAGLADVGETKPGILTQIKKGNAVEQSVAQGAVRRGVQTSAEDAGTANESLSAGIKNQAIAQNGATILDDHLSALQKLEKAAYKRVDDGVGFDLKAEKQQLANDKYKLAQLGNTDADINQRGNLIEAINDSSDRIAEAEQKLKTVGIDPKQADSIHQQRMAGQDFKKILIRSTDSDGQTLNVDKLLTGSKNLRFSKYGDRLAQFFGSKEAADQYMSQLQQAQELGAHALKVQSVAKTIGKWVAGGLVGATALKQGYDLLPKHGE